MEEIINKWSELIDETLAKYVGGMLHTGEIWLLICDHTTANVLGPIKHDKVAINQLCIGLHLGDICAYIMDAVMRAELGQIVLIVISSVGIFLCNYGK